MDPRRARGAAEVSRAGGAGALPNATSAALADAGFTRDAARSCGDDRAENALIHGDNLDVLRRMAASFAGRFKCVYLDPPFNTGRRFAAYDDAWSPDAWREMIRARLAAIHPLVAGDGAVFVEIDDTELAALVGAMDDVFGRANRVSIVTVVRSAGTGHKAINAGPVNVTDFVVVYAKEKRRFRPAAQWHVRAGHDAAYATWLANPDDPPEKWRFSPLARAVAEDLGHVGHAAAHAAKKAIGKDAFAAAVARFALAHAEHVVRFAQPRYEAISGAARALVDRSRAAPSRVFVLERRGLKPMILRGGNRVLFLADKVRTVAGKRAIVEPLTNVWSDVPFQGIAREGGVVFARNKKPERLLERIVAMATSPGDWVLDPFLGSGTTAAVAHKLGRRWIGVERGETMDALCVPRLRRVVAGDDPTGITRDAGWGGGGGFGFHV